MWIGGSSFPGVFGNKRERTWFTTVLYEHKLRRSDMYIKILKKPNKSHVTFQNNIHVGVVLFPQTMFTTKQNRNTT